MGFREPIDQYVIDVVKKLRLSYQLDIHQLAAILGTKCSFVREVERFDNLQKYDIYHIMLLAEYFKISPKYFLPRNALYDLSDDVN